MAKKSSGAHALVSYIHKEKRMNHKDYENCLLTCFLSQMEPKKKVWRLVDLPYGKKAIETKWVYMNKKDKRGIVVTNIARLVAQGHRQEEMIDYDEVFASVARIEAIMIFLAFASFIRFIVSQMDVKSAFLYGTIVEEVYVSQPPGFIDPQFPNKVYKLKQSEEGIFISQDKYVAEILKKFDFSFVKIASTPIETQKPLVKDEVAADVDVHKYKSIIGSLMYLMASRPDIMFAVCACSRDSPFDLEAYLDSDYAGANLDKKSTTGEYVAAAHCCRQVLWIQNEMLDYGFNFMNTKIYIDNESIICIVKNPVYHLKTKHIEIRHHFIICSYEKKLIQVVKIHTDDNVADLLIKYNSYALSLVSEASTDLGMRLMISIGFLMKPSSINLYMVDLKFVDQNNMVACLEKTKENDEFHQIVYYLTTCSINYALTVSPTIYASYIEQFWNTAISKIVNLVKQKHVIVDGKAVVISESSVRSDLLFNDEDGKVTPLFDSMLVQNQAPEGEVSHELQAEAHIEQILPSPSTYQRKHKKTHKPRKAKKDTELPQTSVPLDIGANKAVHHKEGDSVERAITTDASLVVAQDNLGTKKPHWGADAQTRFETASKRSSDPPLSTGHTVGSGEDMMEQKTNLTDFVPTTPYDSPLSEGHTPGCDEGRPNLLELMNICTKLSNMILALVEAKTIQEKVITRLKLRVRRLEKKRKARTSQPIKRRLFKGRVETSTNKSLGRYGVSVPAFTKDHKGNKLNMSRLEKKRKARTSQPIKRRLFKGRVETSTNKSLEVIVKEKGSGEKGGCTADQVSTSRLEVSATTLSTPPPTTTIFGDEDLTIAQTLIKMRSEKAKEKGVAFRDVEEPPRLTRSTTTLQPLLTINLKDKDLAQRIYEEELAELDRAQKERQKQEESTIAALTEEFDEIKPEWMLIMNLLLYEREKKWIDDFVPMDSKKEEKKSVEPKSKDKKGKRIKRVADSVPKQKSSKKQNMMQEHKLAKSDEEESADYEQENKELRMWLTVVLDEE
nr:putative ribonuclease H-like domain-containing protein [Tanacetum cinerariifolium]